MDSIFSNFNFPLILMDINQVHAGLEAFSQNRPTGPIWSSRRDVRPVYVCILSPYHAILPGVKT